MSTLFHADWYCTGESSGLERLRKKNNTTVPRSAKFISSWLQGFPALSASWDPWDTFGAIFVRFLYGNGMKRHVIRETGGHMPSMPGGASEQQNEANVWGGKASRCFFGKDGLTTVKSLKCLSKDVVKIKIESLHQFCQKAPILHQGTAARLPNAKRRCFLECFWEWSREQCRKKTLATWKTI